MEWLQNLNIVILRKTKWDKILKEMKSNVIIYKGKYKGAKDEVKK